MCETVLEVGDRLVHAVDLKVDDGQVLMADPRLVEDAADILEQRLHEPLDIDDLVLNERLRLLPLPDLLFPDLEALAVLLLDPGVGGGEDAPSALSILKASH